MARSKKELLTMAQSRLIDAVDLLEDASDYIRISGAKVEMLHDLLSISHDRLHMINILILQCEKEKSE